MAYDISIIIPFLNEEDNIDNLVKGLGDYLSKQAFSAEVVFVDDGSQDRSVQLLREARHEGYTAKIIKLSQNYGSHAALRAGILHAEGQKVSFMYADLQDPLELIGQMLGESGKGHEIVWACRRTAENGFFEQWFSKTYARMMKKFAIKSFPEKGFDIVMFGQKVRQQLNSNIESNSSIFLQILSMGYRQSTIEYDKRARKAGKSKWTLSKKIKLLIDSFVAFSYFPIRLVSIVGFSFFALGLFWAMYIVGRKLFADDLSSGWPALASILLMGFGITNISLGIIAEYLWRTLDASRKRPVFIIEELVVLGNNAGKPFV